MVKKQQQLVAIVTNAVQAQCTSLGFTVLKAVAPHRNQRIGWVK